MYVSKVQEWMGKWRGASFRSRQRKLYEWTGTGGSHDLQVD